MIHAAEKASKVARDHNQRDGNSLERPAECGKWLVRPAASCEVHAPDCQHQHQGSATGEQMKEKNSLQPPAFEIPLPGQQSGGGSWQSTERCEGEIVVGRDRKILAPGPGGCEVQRDAGEEERDRKMNQHYVLRVSGEKSGANIPGIQGSFPFLWQSRSGHCTITFAVIWGWIEQKYS